MTKHKYKDWDRRIQKQIECPRRLQSSMWRLGQIKYKGVDKKRIRTMECVYIYGYVFFAMGVLFLLGLIGFTWVAL
jgi:hypothetical protein